MQRAKQARAAAYILTRNVIHYSPQSRPVWGEPKNKAKSTRKCMLESWLSLESENGEIEVAHDSCQKLCWIVFNMLAKNLSSIELNILCKYENINMHAVYDLSYFQMQ